MHLLLQIKFSKHNYKMRGFNKVASAATKKKVQFR